MHFCGNIVHDIAVNVVALVNSGLSVNAMATCRPIIGAVRGNLSCGKKLFAAICVNKGEKR